MNTAEIAKMIGISRGTISRVINGHSNVKENTRQRVLAALEEYGYTPNETARSLVMGKVFRIAVIVFSEPAFFWRQVEDGVVAARNDLKALGVAVDYFVTNIMCPAEQLELIHTLPEKGYDGIAIAPNDAALLADEISALSDRGYPVVIINAELPSTNHLCYIGCDYVQAGVVAGELLAKMMCHSGNVAIITLDEPVNSIEQRVMGFRREISKYKDMSITQVCRFGRRVEGVYDEMARMFSTGEQVSGIYVSIGAVEQVAQACVDAGLAGITKVVGYDLNDEIYRYLREGAVTATVCHEPFRQGYYSVKTLHQFLSRGIEPSSSIFYTKLETVLASNAKYYLTEQTLLQLFSK